MQVGIAAKEQIKQIQDLENRIWRDPFVSTWGPTGIAYTKYDQLHDVFPQGILTATENGRLAGYLAFEQIRGYDVRKTGMPPYDHPTSFHKADGRVFYIVNHTVDPEMRGLGASRALITNLQDRARRMGYTVVVMYNHQHPYLTDPQKFWGEYDFGEMTLFRDPNWTPVKGCKATGGTPWKWPRDFSSQQAQPVAKVRVYETASMPKAISHPPTRLAIA
jgi:GNAT superfamily N-acetyltransferase